LLFVNVFVAKLRSVFSTMKKFLAHHRPSRRQSVSQTDQLPSQKWMVAGVHSRANFLDLVSLGMNNDGYCAGIIFLSLSCPFLSLFRKNERSRHPKSKSKAYYASEKVMRRRRQTTRERSTKRQHQVRNKQRQASTTILATLHATTVDSTAVSHVNK
jgi:hypothetical protein